MTRPGKGDGEPVSSTGRNHPVVHHGTARHPFAGGRVSRRLDPEGTGARKAPGGPKFHRLKRANRSDRTIRRSEEPGHHSAPASQCALFFEPMSGLFVPPAAILRVRCPLAFSSTIIGSMFELRSPENFSKLHKRLHSSCRCASLSRQDAPSRLREVEPEPGGRFRCRIPDRCEKPMTLFSEPW